MVPLPTESHNLWTQLTNAINLRSSQDQVLWSVMGIFSAANAILLVALFLDGNFPTKLPVGIVLSMVGVLMSVVWLLVQRRALMRIEHYENLVRNLEDHLGLDARFRVGTSFTRPNGGIRARTVMPWWSSFWAAFWAATSIYSALP